MTTKTKLFSVTAKDCQWDTFRAGGKGGQHQNKTESGVRCRHVPSGAVGEARDSRDQHTNKRSAFQRMASSKEFQAWVRLEAARMTGVQAQVEAEVEQMMHPSQLRVEGKVDGLWVPIADAQEAQA